MNNQIVESVRRLAESCHTLPNPKPGSHEMGLRAILQGPFRTVDARYPYRRPLLGVLAEIAIGKKRWDGMKPTIIEDISSLQSFQPSSAALDSILDAERCHGHVATITIRLIEEASKRFLIREFFLPSCQYDRHFWSLMNSFGRNSQPRETFAAFTVYEAERLIGVPILDVTPFRSILVP